MSLRDREPRPPPVDQTLVDLWVATPFCNRYWIDGTHAILVHGKVVKLTGLKICACGYPATPCDKTKHDYGHDCVRGNEKPKPATVVYQCQGYTDCDRFPCAECTRLNR